MSIFFLCFALLFLIYCSAFFSSSETAFLSLTPLKLRQMRKEKNKRVHLLVSLKSNPSLLLTTLLIGNNFVNSLSSSLATALAISLVGSKGTGIASLAMSVIIILFGEILPKTMATYEDKKIALRHAPILAFLQKILSPITWFFLKFTIILNKTVTRLVPPSTELITEDELKTLFEVGKQEGTLESSEKDMLNKIFEFSDLRVRDIVRPAPLVKAISIDSDYESIQKIFKETGYSRLPVYENSFDTIKGWIHIKDVLFYGNAQDTFVLKKHMHPMLFVPETKFAIHLLQLFKAEKQSIATVISEHGKNDGIVTVDDLLKAVFGRITDEYNTKLKSPEERIQLIGQNEFIIPGDLLLSEVNTIFGLFLESEDCDTFGGWLLEEFGYLPQNTETIQHGKLIFTVEEQNHNRIQRIRMLYAKEKLRER